MNFMTNRLMVLSVLLMPSMLTAKPAPKKKPKPAPPAAAANEDLAAPVVPPPPPPYAANYGMAGCGLGSELIKEDGFIQIFAGTTNGTVANQSFGISFGTVHCNPSHKTLALEQKVFIEANLVSLKREAVSGQGETLTAFADLLGCQSAQFSQVSKDNYGVIYKASEPEQILQGYKAVLSTQCTRLI